jgi:hypothetical protein
VWRFNAGRGGGGRRGVDQRIAQVEVFGALLAVFLFLEKCLSVLHV